MRHLKVRYFKSWGSEARRLGMAERNRLTVLEFSNIRAGKVFKF